MFSKILVANRGEIACRIMRTARRMGIGTVAVYSDADADSLHVRMADESVRIGPAPSAESYLRVDAIVAAAVATGAQAVHPGFGFLAENARFAEALGAAGVSFIGPDAGAIRAMGDKIESKRIAEAAGVSTIPGHPAALADAEEAVARARDLGFPVMLKASAGGGGKGMRVARSEAEVRDGFTSAASEARSSFGDGRLLIEKFVEEPRHIEIQVIADGHGSIVHLGERECSIQRRHQKVVEEAPSPFLDPATRAAMGAQAVALARAVDYRSAGTVEFVVDAHRNFYFLEMNTRLQVEHPVTEAVTGLDLVELMLRVAAGEPLPFRQEEVAIRGWAVEARIYAEDPERNFLPSSGRLVRYRPPPEEEGVRIDAGVFEGAEISVYYDPMIAKLVTRGETRGEAITRMADALDVYCIEGVVHNIPFLAALMRDPWFREGRISTAFIDRRYPDGFVAAEVVPKDPDRLIAVAALMQRTIDRRQRAAAGAGGSADGADRYVALVGAETARAVPVVIRADNPRLEISCGEQHYVVEHEWRPGDLLFRGRMNGEPVTLQAIRSGLRWRLTEGGHVANIRILPPHAAGYQRLMPLERAPDTSRYVTAPMPGLLVRVSVELGERVKTGQELAVIEAMKMENVLFAEREGTVAAILANAGDSLAADQPVIEFE